MLLVLWFVEQSKNSTDDKVQTRNNQEQNIKLNKLRYKIQNRVF